MRERERERERDPLDHTVCRDVGWEGVSHLLRSPGYTNVSRILPDSDLVCLIYMYLHTCAQKYISSSCVHTQIHTLLQA